MSTYLLDTHALLWMQDDNDSLSNKVRTILTDKTSELNLSIASLWEIVIKVSIGKLELNYSLDDLITACKTNDITILPLLPSSLKQLQILPQLHKDPFDRIIAATALDLNMTVITRDDNIKKYDLPTVW